MSELNKEVAIKFTEVFSRGDAAVAENYLAPDVVTYAKGFGELSGPHHFEMIIATTSAFKNLIPIGLRPNFHTVMGEGDRVAAEFEDDAILANGEAYCNQYCMVFTLKDGKIKQVNKYYCTIVAAAKIGRLLAEVEARRKAKV